MSRIAHRSNLVREVESLLLFNGLKVHLEPCIINVDVEESVPRVANIDRVQVSSHDLQDGRDN